MFSVQSNKALTMDADIKEGANLGTLPADMMSLNSFMWVVNTSAPFEAVSAEMRVPWKCIIPPSRIGFRC